MNREIREIMKRLGAAINDSLQDAGQVQELLREMEEKGYTMTLSLAVIVKPTASPDAPAEEAPRQRRPRQAPVPEHRADLSPTPFDRKFLKALRIRISEEQT